MSVSITQWLSVPDVGGPVSCGVCGCRLVEAKESQAWRHYPSSAVGQDARGCRPACVDKIHDRSGRAVSDLLPA